LLRAEGKQQRNGLRLLRVAEFLKVSRREEILGTEGVLSRTSFEGRGGMLRKGSQATTQSGQEKAKDVSNKLWMPPKRRARLARQSPIGAFGNETCSHLRRGQRDGGILIIFTIGKTRREDPVDASYVAKNAGESRPDHSRLINSGNNS